MSETTVIPADQPERDAAIDIRKCLLVKAPAGSGKTRLLVERTMAALAAVDEPEDVLAITFTNKAASEIRDRLLKALAGQAESAGRFEQLAAAVRAHDAARGWSLCTNPNRLQVMTIDALNGFLARSAPVVSGTGGALNVEDDPRRAYRDAVLSLFARLDDERFDPGLREAMGRLLRFARNRIEQLIPFLVDMLAKREQWLPLAGGLREGADVAQSLADVVRKTFEGRMAAALEAIGGGRAAALASAAHTAGKLEGAAWPAASLNDAKDRSAWSVLCGLVLTKEKTLRKKLTAREGFPAGLPSTMDVNAVMKDLAESGAATIESALLGLDAIPDPAELVDVQGNAQALCRVLWQLAGELTLSFQKLGAVDFQEVGLRALMALGSGTDASALLERMDYRLKHILVDEAQDTSLSQYRLLSALTCDWQDGDGRTLFMVGDPQQSVYGFRQADVRMFMDLWRARRFNQLTLEPVTLTSNFRSVPEIVGWCNQTFSHAFPSRDDLETEGVSFTPASAALSGAGGVTVHAFNTFAVNSEAARIVEVVKAAQARDPAGSIAVLVRNRRDVEIPLAALKAAGISYACQDIEPLASTDSVRDVIALTRALWHDQDRASWGLLMRAPFVGLSMADLLEVSLTWRFKGAIEGLLQSIPKLSTEGQRRARNLADAVLDARKNGRAYDLPAQVEYIWNRLGGPACVTVSQLDDVKKTIEVLRKHCEGGRLLDLGEFERGLRKLYAAPGTGAVQIMTVHKSKGLEMDTVILCGLWRKGRSDDKPLLGYRRTEHGLMLVSLPDRRASAAQHGSYGLWFNIQGTAGRNEDLRVLYVAATRARKNLHVMVCGKQDKECWGPEGGSLAELIWPSLAPSFSAAVTPEIFPTVATGLIAPFAPRLPADWSAPQIPESYIPPESTTLLPSELVVREDAAVDRRAESQFDRIVGTVYHEMMQQLAERRGVPALATVLMASAGARLRRLGLSERLIEDGVKRLDELLTSTLASAEGQWLLKERETEMNEFRIGGYREGVWVSGSVDRAFVEDGYLVLADYKSGGRGLNDEAYGEYIAREASRYAAQVREYAALMGEIQGLPVKCGLFFASTPKYVSV